MPKVNLHDMHEDIAGYFQMILRLHTAMVTQLQTQLQDEEITSTKFNLDMRECALAPAVLTVITQFLKTNNIMTIPDTLDRDLTEFEDKVAKMKKNGTSMNDMDDTVELN